MTVLTRLSNRMRPSRMPAGWWAARRSQSLMLIARVCRSLASAAASPPLCPLPPRPPSHPSPVTMDAKLSSSRMTLAASRATSLASGDPMATPTWARFSAGESFTPSPVTATTSLSRCRLLTICERGGAL